MPCNGSQHAKEVRFMFLQQNNRKNIMPFSQLLDSGHLSHTKLNFGMTTTIAADPLIHWLNYCSTITAKATDNQTNKQTKKQTNRFKITTIKKKQVKQLAHQGRRKWGKVGNVAKTSAIIIPKLLIHFTRQVARNAQGMLCTSGVFMLAAAPDCSSAKMRVVM